MKKTFNPRVVLCLLLAARGVFAQCGIAPEPGVRAADWNEIFTQNGPGTKLEPPGAAGWTGADSTYSLELPNGDSAFFFSDSFIAEWPRKDGDATVFVDERGLRTHKPNCFPPLCAKPETTHYVYNSIVVRSRDGQTLKTLLGPKNANGFSTSYFRPADPAHLFWVGDSALVRAGRDGAQKLWIFLYEWKIAEPGKPFTFEFFGASLAALNPSTLAVESIAPLRNVGEKDSHWGVAAWFEKSGFYIYGKKIVGGKKKLFVARVDPKIGIDRVRDTRNWKAWDGRKWTAGLENAASLVPAADSISDEISVKKFVVGGRPRYLMVTLDTAVAYPGWKDIYLYSACAPEGPFADKYSVYTTPEAGSDKLPGMSATEKMANRMVVYNPHLHPQFTENGRLLISYNTNLPFGSLPGDSIYADFYRPYFARVAVAGLKN